MLTPVSGFSYIKIDGVELVTHSSIGVDMSGNSNHLHDQNFVLATAVKSGVMVLLSLSLVDLGDLYLTVQFQIKSQQQMLLFCRWRSAITDSLLQSGKIRIYASTGDPTRGSAIN